MLYHVLPLGDIVIFIIITTTTTTIITIILILIINIGLILNISCTSSVLLTYVLLYLEVLDELHLRNSLEISILSFMYNTLADHS